MTSAYWSVGFAWRRVDLLAALFALASLAVATAFLSDATPLRGSTSSHDSSAYGKLPLSFIPNKGQTDEQVRYHAQGSGFSFHFTDRKAVLALTKGKRGQALELRFPGANPDAKLVGGEKRTGTVNFLRGSDPAKHQTGLPTYGTLTYKELWPGIDMVFRGAGGKLKYEFLVSPGTDPGDIRLAYAGADGLSLGATGTLLIDTPLGTLKDSRPHSYQRIDGRRVPVESRFSLTEGAKTYGFHLARHNPNYPLVIDPALAYSTYLGGNGFEFGLAVDVDQQGNAYVTGQTSSSDFPTTAGAFDTSSDGGVDTFDAFVTKLDATGSGLVYSTYLSGTGEDGGAGIAVDGAGNAFVTGSTSAPDFPTTPGAFDRTRGESEFESLDAFVTKLDASGSTLAYSTYLGSSGDDYGAAIALDGNGSAYVTGSTNSQLFPTTPAAFDTSTGYTDAFVTKLDPSGSSLAYSTFLGGQSNTDYGAGIVLDGDGNAYVTGHTNTADFPTTLGAFDTSYAGNDVFVTKLNATGSILLYSTFLGGSTVDQGFGIALDGTGNAYITGRTEGAFPTTPGAFDQTGSGAFVTKLNASGSALAYSTYLHGTNRPTLGNAIAVDGIGSAYVTGSTAAFDFPTTSGAFDISYAGGSDAFFTRLNASGSALAYSTYLGGTRDEHGYGIALGGAEVYITGDTGSASFPTTPGAFDESPNGNTDSFVAKLDLTGSGQRAASTAVECSPQPVQTFDTTTCTATLTDTDSGSPVTPTGTVSFTHDQMGFFSSTSCTLSPTGTTGVARCSVVYTPTVAGKHTIQAGYTGSAAHAASSGSTQLLVFSKYPAPTGGATLRVPLVPAFRECISPNNSHAGALPSDSMSLSSCSNPQLGSSTATLGNSTAMGTRIGYADVAVCHQQTFYSPPRICNPELLGSAPDVRLRGNGSDIVCTIASAACPGGAGSDYDPNLSPGPYTTGLSPGTDSNVSVPKPNCKPSPPNPSSCAVGADMTAIAVLPGSSASPRAIRITDSYNSLRSTGDPFDCGANTSCSATVRDQGFPVPVVCQANVTAGLGSYCGANTTANALVPGVIVVGKGAVVELGQVQVYDSGPDGVRGNSDDELFAVQGIFVP